MLITSHSSVLNEFMDVEAKQHVVHQHHLHVSVFSQQAVL